MTITSTEPSVTALWDTIAERIARGDRFAGLHAGPHAAPGAAVTLTAHLATAGGIDTLEAALPPGAASYPSLTTRVNAAFWYERVIRDRFAIVPDGHPRLAPLISPPSQADPALPRHVEGYGMFTIPHGPVRSGVLESIEYLVETPGEAIPHLNMRIFYKHRAIADAFAGRPVADGVLLAERTEGIATVAHALAYCHAVEAIAGCEVPREAGLVRVIHAELERIANHLDVAMKLADAAGLAIANARLAVHKERVMRLVSSLCGSRFCRGVIVPGGVSGFGRLGEADGAFAGNSPRRRLLGALDSLATAVTADMAVLLGTSSFLDRLRGTGPLTPGRAREHGALGPVGKASGYADDARTARPYDGYPLLARQGADEGAAAVVTGSRQSAKPAPVHHSGDALARLLVRTEEITQAFGLIRHALSELPQHIEVPPATPCHPLDGRATGWAEAPQGEVLYDVTVADGKIAACQPRSASFHNLVLMHEVFAGDILTDFPFIEASLGISVAGAAL